MTMRKVTPTWPDHLYQRQILVVRTSCHSITVLQMSTIPLWAIWRTIAATYNQLNQINIDVCGAQHPCLLNYSDGKYVCLFVFSFHAESFSMHHQVWLLMCFFFICQLKTSWSCDSKIGLGTLEPRQHIEERKTYDGQAWPSQTGGLWVAVRASHIHVIYIRFYIVDWGPRPNKPRMTYGWACWTAASVIDGAPCSKAEYSRPTQTT